MSGHSLIKERECYIFIKVHELFCFLFCFLDYVHKVVSDTILKSNGPRQRCMFSDGHLL